MKSRAAVPEAFLHFFRRVEGELDWPPARRAVHQELADHLEDHTAALIRKGTPEPEAQERAVSAMGDPVALGEALNKLHSPYWHHVARGLTIIAVCLVLLLTLYNSHSDRHFLDDLAEAFAPPGDPTADAFYYTGAVTPLRTGRAEGHGWLGRYRFSAAGPAALVRETAADKAPFLMVRFPLSTFHWQPWLGKPDPYYTVCQAWDDLGNVYPPTASVETGESACTIDSTGTMMTILYPDPTATSYTVQVAAISGDTATFTVVLDEEVSAP